MQQIRSCLGLKLCLHCIRLCRRLQHAHYALCTPRHTPSSTHDTTPPVPPSSIRSSSDVLCPCRAEKARGHRLRMRSSLGLEVCLHRIRLCRRLQHSHTTRFVHPDIPPARHMTPHHRPHPTASEARATYERRAAHLVSVTEPRAWRPTNNCNCKLGPLSRPRTHRRVAPLNLAWVWKLHTHGTKHN